MGGQEEKDEREDGGREMGKEWEKTGVCETTYLLWRNARRGATVIRETCNSGKKKQFP